MTLIKKEYPAIDLMKILMAVLIFLAHVASEKVDVHPYFKIITSLYNFGVPFFVTASSFFFFAKLMQQDKDAARKSYIKMSKHIGATYLYWSLIYFCFILSNWIIEGATTEQIFRYFHTALVFTTYGTIWFLPALWIGISICYLLVCNNVSLKRMLVLSVIFWLIGSLGYTYNNLLANSALEQVYALHDALLVTTRNGVFFGFPAAAIGMFVYVAQGKASQRHSIYLLLAMIFGVAYIAEAVIIKHLQLGTNVDMGIFMLPTIYFLMRWLMIVDLPSHRIYLWFRNMSVLIFLSQRLFVSAIPSFMSGELLLAIKGSSYIGIVGYFLIVVLFSATILHLSKRYKLLRKLW